MALIFMLGIWISKALPEPQAGERTVSLSKVPPVEPRALSSPTSPPTTSPPHMRRVWRTRPSRVVSFVGTCPCLVRVTANGRSSHRENPAWYSTCTTPTCAKPASFQSLELPGVAAACASQRAECFTGIIFCDSHS